MSANPVWMYWVIAGIICIVVEIFVYPAFFFLSLGIGGIVTGILSFIGIFSKFLWLQILVFVIVSFIAFLSMKKLSSKVLAKPETPTNVYALMGQTGMVVAAIPENGKGYVKLGGEEWSSISKDGSAIPAGTRVQVVALEGNKVIVALPKEES